MELFKYLIDHQVHLNVSMICDDPSQSIELLYYSQIKYVPLLIQHGCHLDPEKVGENVGKFLVKGNITKLIALYQYGAVTKEQLIAVLQQKGLIFIVLDQLYERVFNLSQQIEADTHISPKEKESYFQKVYDEILKNYLNTFKFFFKNGVTINQMDDGESFVQKVLNTYFFPLIQLVINQGQANWETTELLHYSNFSLINRQVMKYIYTDHIYQMIDEFMRDKMPPKKIVVKKVMMRKITQPTGQPVGQPTEQPKSPEMSVD